MVYFKTSHKRSCFKLTEASKTKQKFSTRDMAYIALFAVLIAICSWISIPMTIPFTMQTFAIFLALGILGGKRGTLSIIVYILLGIIGLPVFSGFKSGLGILLGTTGGYIIGFVISSLLFWLITSRFGKKTHVLIISMLIGLLSCYAFGTAWFMYVYTSNSGAIGLITTLGYCVFPFIIPDLIKIALAAFLTKKLGPMIKI